MTLSAQRYFAFLRAINVGGHTVKMDHLRSLCEEIGLINVETFIASGNIIFESDTLDARSLEIRMEEKFHQALGYQVATFVRNETELRDVSTFQPFSQTKLADAQALNIAFLSHTPDDQSLQKLMALETELDSFQCTGREIYWLCAKKQSESTFSNAVLEKTLGQKSTLRGTQTIQKIAVKYITSHH